MQCKDKLLYIGFTPNPSPGRGNLALLLDQGHRKCPPVGLPPDQPSEVAAHAKLETETLKAEHPWRDDWA
jgi:hypothetical protein